MRSQATWSVYRICCGALAALSAWSGLVSAQLATTPPGGGPAPGPGLASAPSTQDPFPLPSYLFSSTADNAAVKWNKAIQWVVSTSNATNASPRLFAFTHLALWQALRANNASAVPANDIAVASYAAVLTLKDLLPLYLNRYDALFFQLTAGLTEAQLEAAHDIAGPVVTRLLSTRLDDGFQLPSAAEPTSGSPGQFLDTGTAKTQPVQEYAVTDPLLLPANFSSLDFIADCTPPPEVPSSDYNIQYTSATLYGSATSDVRSNDQTDAAIFWSDGGAGTSSLQGQWNRVALNTMSTRITLARTAELLAMLNVGLYDTTIANFYLKYSFDFWRPVTAIRNGDPSHEPQPSWTPLLANPNSPSYPSVGSAYAGLAEKVLISFYGRDTLIFTVSTENRGPGGVLLPNRVYQSFTQMASSVVQSRYFGGTEFPIDSTVGRTIGGEVGQYVMANFQTLNPLQ